MWVHRARWKAAARLVAGSRNLLDDRPGAGESLPALAARGWDAFLLSLSDPELSAIEAHGREAPWPDRTPSSLRSLVERAREVCALPALSMPDPPSRAARRGET